LRARKSEECEISFCAEMRRFGEKHVDFTKLPISHLPPICHSRARPIAVPTACSVIFPPQDSHA